MNDATALAIKKRLEVIDREIAAIRTLLDEDAQSSLVLSGEDEKQPEGDILPKNWRRMSTNERKRRKVLRNSPEMCIIGTWFGRQPETLWTVAEAIPLVEDPPTLRQVNGMGVYMTAEMPKDQDFRRKTIQTLTNNWAGELDRARAYVKSLQ